MKVGDLICRKAYGYYHAALGYSHKTTYDFDKIYIVIRYNKEAGMVKILDATTGEFEVIPDSDEFYEVINESR